MKAILRCGLYYEFDAFTVASGVLFSENIVFFTNSQTGIIQPFCLLNQILQNVLLAQLFKIKRVRERAL